MWKIESEPVSYDVYDLMIPDTILVWVDGLRVYTFLDKYGGLNLAHWLDGDSNYDRFVAIPLFVDQLNKLNDGSLSFRELIERRQVVFIVDQSINGGVNKKWFVFVKDIPETVLPTRRGLTA